VEIIELTDTIPCPSFNFTSDTNIKIFLFPSPIYHSIMKRERSGPGMVVHFCNPTYWRGRDLEDCSLNLAQAKS
jgi:hypothetical protein